MTARGAHPRRRWVRHLQLWWFETPPAEIVRMVIVLVVVSLAAVGLVVLVMLRG